MEVDSIPIKRLKLAKKFYQIVRNKSHSSICSFRLQHHPPNENASVLCYSHFAAIFKEKEVSSRAKSTHDYYCRGGCCRSFNALYETHRIHQHNDHVNKQKRIVSFQKLTEIIQTLWRRKTANKSTKQNRNLYGWFVCFNLIHTYDSFIETLITKS